MPLKVKYTAGRLTAEKNVSKLRGRADIWMTQSIPVGWQEIVRRVRV